MVAQDKNCTLYADQFILSMFEYRNAGRNEKKMLHMACSLATILSSSKSKLSMDFSQTITQWDVTTSRDRASPCRHFIMGLCDKAINGVILLLVHLSVSIIDILCWLTHLTSGQLSPGWRFVPKWLRNQFWEDIFHLLATYCYCYPIVLVYNEDLKMS